MRTKLALAGTLVATAVPGAVLAVPAVAPAQVSPSASGTSCGRIKADGRRLAVWVTYGSYRCADARAVMRTYFRRVDARSNRTRKITIRRGKQRFACQSAITGQMDFICFPRRGSKPIVAADRIGS